MHSGSPHRRFLPQPQYQELLQALHFIAQHEGSLEEAHATTLLATVYDMYVNDWEVRASGAAGQAASAASGAHCPEFHFLSTRPEFYVYMEMVLRLVGRFCDLSAAAGMLRDLHFGHRRAWGNDEGSDKSSREHCLEALVQIQWKYKDTEEFQTWALRYGGQYGVCAAPASGGLWAFAPQIATGWHLLLRASSSGGCQRAPGS